jgi:hypothetical protein
MTDPEQAMPDLLALWCPVHEYYNLVPLHMRYARGCTCGDPETITVNITVKPA